MTIKATIYKPAKSAMQSGHSATKEWVLSYEEKTPRRPEQIMGWIAAQDTLNQVKMHFESCDDAIDFAKARGFKFDVIKEQKRQVKPRSYLDNFKYFPPEDEDDE